MNFPTYAEVTYKELQKEINKAWADYLLNKGNEIKLAGALKVRTTQTVRNAFAPIKQVVSDDLLSGVMDCLEMDAFIVWNKRKRRYFVKPKV